MKKKYTVSKLFSFLIAALLLVSSCTKEDLDNCPPQHNVRIVVKTLAETTTETEGDKYDIDNITIYIFDDEYRFVDAWEGGRYTKGEEYGTNLKLEPDRQYQFVAWTNRGETYKTNFTLEECRKNKPEMGDLTMEFVYPNDSIVLTNMPDLHHGILHTRVEANKENIFTIILKPNTYTINYTAEGLPVNNDTYSFTVRDNNSHYDFQNRFIANIPHFNYVRTSQFVAGETILRASKKVLRLTENRNPHFSKSRDTPGTELFSGNLVTLIKAAYEKNNQILDFDKTFEFTIHLSYSSHLGITVSVNGWSYTENPIEL